MICPHCGMRCVPEKDGADLRCYNCCRSSPREEWISTDYRSAVSGILTRWKLTLKELYRIPGVQQLQKGKQLVASRR